MLVVQITGWRNEVKLSDILIINKNKVGRGKKGDTDKVANDKADETES